MDRYGELIPPELIRIQLLFLESEDIVRFRRVSKEWRNIIDKNEIWFILINRDFPYQPHVKNHYHDDYKRLYKYKYMPFILIQDIKDTVFNTDDDVLRDLRDSIQHDVMPKLRYSVRSRIIRNLGNINPDVSQFLFNTLKNMGFQRFRNIMYYDPKRIFKTPSLILNFISKKVDRKTIFIQGCREWHYHLNDHALEIQKTLLLKVIPKILNYRKQIFCLSYRNIKLIYEKVYGEDSFDKKFLKEANHHVNRWKNPNDILYDSTFKATSQDLLDNFNKQLK